MPADQQETETIEEIEAQTRNLYVLIGLLLFGAVVWDKYREKY